MDARRRARKKGHDSIVTKWQEDEKYRMSQKAHEWNRIILPMPGPPHDDRHLQHRTLAPEAPVRKHHHAMMIIAKMDRCEREKFFFKSTTQPLTSLRQDKVDAPTAGTAKACILRLQVLRHRTGTSVSRLCGNQTALCVQTQPQKSSQKLFFPGGNLVLFSALMVGQLCQRLPCFLCLSCPDVWSLSGFMKPPGSQSIQQAQVWSTLS